MLLLLTKRRRRRQRRKTPVKQQRTAAGPPSSSSSTFCFMQQRGRTFCFALTAFPLPQVQRQMALTAEQSAELRRGGSPATAVPFFGQENCSGLCVSVWMPAMISTPMKISKQRDREPQIFFVSGEGDCETKQSGSFGTKNWAAINALRHSPSLGTVNPKETRPSPSWHKLRHKRILCLLKRRTLQTDPLLRSLLFAILVAHRDQTISLARSRKHYLNLEI